MELLKEGNGAKAVVLAHGYDQNADEWGGFFLFVSEELQKVGFTVYRFQFNQTTLTDEIKQLEEIIHRVKKSHETVYAVGMSTGALATAYETEPVKFKMLISPVVSPEKTFPRIPLDRHPQTTEWIEDIKKYSLEGKKLEDCFMYYSDNDKYIALEEFETVDCPKKLMKEWGHGPETPEQMRQIGQEIATKLSELTK